MGEMGTLYGVSVGPGDPELLTLKAVRIISETEVIAVPGTGRALGTAYGIVAGQIDLTHKTMLPCPTPMTDDVLEVQAAHQQTAERICALLATGTSVAYLCLGDVSVYSSFSYIRDLVRKRGHHVVAIPGVTSFCAAAATLGTSLCQGSERLLVTSATEQNLDEALDVFASRVIMKPKGHIAELRRALETRGELSRASMVSRCGFVDERVFPQLSDVDLDDGAGYLSVIIVRPPHQDE